MPEKKGGNGDSGRGQPAARAFWSGTITFGLVSLPVDFLPAIRPKGGGLKMLSPDGTPLQRRYVCPREDEPVSGDEIVRGYELEEGEYVLVTDEELEAAQPEKTREIDLQRFVKADEIDPVFFERAYFLAPAGDSTKAYRLLVKAMEQANRAGIGTFVMRGREYLAAIVADHGLLRAETMRFADEIRSPEDVGLPKKPGGSKKKGGSKVEKALLKAIDDLTADELDPDELEDRTTETLERIVARKLAEGEDVAPLPEELEPEEDEQVIDLMAELKRRLKASESDGEGDGKRSDEKPRGKKDELDEMSKEELYAKAQDLDIAGRSKMTKPQLLWAIQRNT